MPPACDGSVVRGRPNLPSTRTVALIRSIPARTSPGRPARAAARWMPRRVAVDIQSGGQTMKARRSSAVLVLLVAITALVIADPVGSPAQSAQPVRFAVIGDYGLAGSNEAAVAALAASWAPDFIITTGDNNYYYGAAETIDRNIGQYYHAYISPYHGSYGPGATTNRFFPVLGNHDWDTPGAKPYLNYFTLPGNERYYDVVRGPVHFFMLDSDPREPDGTKMDSVQAAWL